jgi:Helix-turn-helix of DDE superfamily endonuclease
MMLEHWREYRTYFHIGQARGISESAAYRNIKWRENTLAKSKAFRLPGRKQKQSIIRNRHGQKPRYRPQGRENIL